MWWGTYWHDSPTRSGRGGASPTPTRRRAKRGHDPSTGPGQVVSCPYEEMKDPWTKEEATELMSIVGDELLFFGFANCRLALVRDGDGVMTLGSGALAVRGELKG